MIASLIAIDNNHMIGYYQIEMSLNLQFYQTIQGFGFM